MGTFGASLILSRRIAPPPAPGADCVDHAADLVPRDARKRERSGGHRSDSPRSRAAAGAAKAIAKAAPAARRADLISMAVVLLTPA
jgi:hypothetical protein